MLNLGHMSKENTFLLMILAGLYITSRAKSDLEQRITPPPAPPPAPIKG